MRDQTDSRTLPLPLGRPPYPILDTWRPYVVCHGVRFIGVYWAPDARRAASDARFEAASFGPVSLRGARLTVELHAAASRPGVEAARVA